MSVYKDEKNGTWRCIYRYTNWKGERKQTQKRGFRTKREALGKSQRVLADEFAFQRSLLSRLENGVNEPKLVSIWTVSEALGLRPHELIKMVEDELPESFSLIDR